MVDRWAPTPPWMESCTASHILSNFSRNLAISARIFIQVRLFFQAIIFAVLKILYIFFFLVANYKLYCVQNCSSKVCWAVGMFILHSISFCVWMSCELKVFIFSFYGGAFKRYKRYHGTFKYTYKFIISVCFFTNNNIFNLISL